MAESTNPPARSARTLARWALAIVPLVALWELLAHWWIVRSVPQPDDWRAANTYIRQQRRTGDLVASAPWWTDPLARLYLGEQISLEDAARPDASRYQRALVATIRGGEHPDFRGWTEESSQRFGRVTVRILRNPSPARVLFDFVQNVRPPQVSVFRVDASGAVPCMFRSGLPVEGGGLGQGALGGPERFLCGAPWHYVGRTVIEDMDHRGRLCVWAHPGDGSTTRTVYTDVPVGTVLRGYHAVAYEAERGGDHGETGAPITLVIRAGDRVLGRDVHTDGEGWKRFEFDTRALNGTRAEITFEVSSPDFRGRHYCFQAETR